MHASQVAHNSSAFLLAPLTSSPIGELYQPSPTDPGREGDTAVSHRTGVQAENRRCLCSPKARELWNQGTSERHLAARRESSLLGSWSFLAQLIRSQRPACLSSLRRGWGGGVRRGSWLKKEDELKLNLSQTPEEPHPPPAG